MLQFECIEAFKEAEIQVINRFDSIQLPVKVDQELKEMMEKIEKTATEEFNKRCTLIEMDIRKVYLEKLETFIARFKESKRQENINIKSENELRKMTITMEEQKQ